MYHSKKKEGFMPCSATQGDMRCPWGNFSVFELLVLCLCVSVCVCVRILSGRSFIQYLYWAGFPVATVSTSPNQSELSPLSGVTSCEQQQFNSYNDHVVPPIGPQTQYV
jgi:hypothetical protein